MSNWLLDASALLALLKLEPGAETTEGAVLEGAAISCVNWSEVIAKLGDIGLSMPEAAETVDALGLTVLPFDRKHAVLCAELRAATRAAGFSFADRACLATAKLENTAVLTADRAWSSLEIGVDIRLIR